MYEAGHWTEEIKQVRTKSLDADVPFYGLDAINAEASTI